MDSLREVKSQFKFLSKTLQDFGTMPIFKRTLSQDLNLLEQHLTKDILSQTDCKTILTKLRTTFENTFNSEFKERMQKYTRFDAQSFKDAMICNMDSIGKYMLEIILHQQRTPQLLKQKKLMQTQEDHSNPIPALNVDSLKVDLVVIQNTCSEKEDSNSETASSKSVKESSLDSATKDVHAIKYKMSKAKERCMAYFRSLHSHLQVLSKEDLKGTRIEHGFKRAFMSLFGQDHDTFTNKYFVEYTRIEVKHFRNTLLQHMGNVKKSVAERTRHQRQYDRRVNKRRADARGVRLIRVKQCCNADIRLISDEEAIWMRYDGLLNVNFAIDSGKGFCNFCFKNDLRKLKGNSVDTKFAKTSVLEKSVLQSLRNQSVVRQLNAFKSERPQMSKPRFASQVDVNNNLSRPVTQHYLPKRRESVFAKPDHMIASSESRNSSKNMSRFSSNDMVHNHYLDEARKTTQERDRNSKTSVMSSARYQSTADGSKPKPRSNNQTPRSLPVSKSSCVTITVVPKVDHSKSSNSFLDFKQFVCSTCHKCVFNANHDACLTKLLKEVNSRAKIQSYKTKNSNKLVDQQNHTQKPGRQIFTRHRWIPTGKLFDSCSSKVDSEPTHGSNVDIPNIHESKQTLDLSAELESLFGSSFDEYFNGENQVVSKSSAVTTADASDKRQQQPDSTSSTLTLATTVSADGNFDL
ncbi:hypothetical protein Tco_0519916 [Tanacetum coccineum]